MIDAACPICQTPLTPGQDPCPRCGAARGSETLTRNLPVGHTLQHGRFTVGRVLGEGGFGITYQGTHRDIGHPVALKEYVPAHAQRVGTAVSVPAPQQEAFVREREGMLKEAKILFGLRAPGIVQIYDAFQENGTVYIVMEYLEGQTLEERIQREVRIPANEVQRLAQALGQALEAVHAQNLLHRDIKPANVILTPEGRIVLIDFGSARAFQRDRTQRHTRIVTPGYAAPEQYSEEARFGPYTDLFGLGATLYHALTGTPPPSAIDRLQSGRAPSFPTGLPAPLADAVRQALELRVDDRPSSVTAFLDLMQRSPSTAPTSYTTPAVALASRAGTKVPSRKSSLASAPNGDRNALADLYWATNGAQWRSNKNWLSDAPLGTWFGVTVDKTDRVTGLELDSNGLSGSIPPELGQLAHLQFLSLGSAQRPAPPMGSLGFPSFPRGQWLTTEEIQGYASTSNTLSGSIPPELGQLVRLQFLSLEDCSSSGGQLSGVVPSALGQLTDLRCLSLEGNRLSGSIPPELGQLTHLQVLLLGDNQLSGAVPSALGQLTDLRYLSLEGNRLSGSIPPELGQLTHLQVLLLGDNQLSGAVPSALGQLPRLKSLSLEGNRLSGAVLSALGGNRLSGAVLSALGQQPNLQVNTKQLSIWERLFRQQKDKEWRGYRWSRYGRYERVHTLWEEVRIRIIDIDTTTSVGGAPSPPALRNT